MRTPATEHTVRSEYQPLVAVLVAACGGIALDRWLNWSLGWWMAMAAITWTAWWLLWHQGRLRSAAVLLLTSVAATGGAWHHCRWSLFASDELAFCAPEVPGPVAIEVRATSGPRRIPASTPDPLRTIATPERTRLEVEVLAVRNRDAWQPTSGRASLLITGHVFDVRPGDRLRAFAQWAQVRPPANPGEFDFAAQARGRRQMVAVNCEFPECVSIQAGGGRWLP